MTKVSRVAGRVLVGPLLFSVALVGGCAMPQDSMVDANTGPKTDLGVRSGATLTPVLSLGYSGTERTLVAPEGITSAQLRLSGGAGGGSSYGGMGSVLAAEVPVSGGATLGISVGGLGADNKSNKSPGGGGWGLVAGGVDLRGGPGGHGYGLGVDGSGGGGASAVRVNGVVQLVAGGGGGSAGSYVKGYSGGGYPSGSAGYGKSGGRGGGPDTPNLVSAGADGSHSLFGNTDAGAGGGGGYYSGGGGSTDGNGGGGAGYAAPGVTVVSSGTGTGAVAGSATLAWQPGAPTLQPGVLYEIRKAGAPTEQLLEIRGASDRDGGVVDTYMSVPDGNGSAVQNNELWHFVADVAGDGYGQIVNAGSAKCLDYNDDNGQVDEWRCDSSDGQPGDRLWKLVENGPGGTAFVNKTTDKYLATTAQPSKVGNLTTVQLDASQSDRSSWLVYRSGPAS